MDTITKERSSNFSAEDVILLRELVDAHKNILLNKKSDAVHVKEKDQTWELLATKYNASCPANRYRSTKQLRNKFKNLKKSARKESSQFTKERRKTGGGPPPSKLSDNASWMQGAMQLSMEGITSEFDDDASITAEILPCATILHVSPEEPTVEEADVQTPYLMEFVTVEDPPLQCASEYQGVATKRLPITPSLKSLSRKRKASTPHDVRKNFIELAEAKKKSVDSSSDLDLEHKKIAHEQEYRHREAIFELKMKQHEAIFKLKIKHMQHLHELKVKNIQEENRTENDFPGIIE